MTIQERSLPRQAMRGEVERQVVVRVTGSGRNVGKTTLATSLVEELSERGYRVAAVKQTHHPLPPDRVGSDSDRLARAGAATTVLANGGEVLQRRPRNGDTLQQLCRSVADCDIVIAEGFRDDPFGAELRVESVASLVQVTGADGRPLEPVDRSRIHDLASVIECWYRARIGSIGSPR